jgi:squalene-hopene/tetraprenyl-beta-curcumene cyclase
VPDADDTAGAQLALRHLGEIDGEARDAARRGIRWLLNLQNRDGGMPTFCRGWGKLPFDRSGADLTAHAVAAWQAWLPQMDAAMRTAIERAMVRANSYLERTQNADGSWTPLWFGNEHAPEETNPAYGTARTVMALARSQSPMLARALRWLEAAQNADGGWGGAPGTPSSIEETSLAVQALAAARSRPLATPLNRGVEWLVRHTEHGSRLSPTPIGLYFARLWYFEELYPVIFSVASLVAAKAVFEV